MASIATEESSPTVLESPRPAPANRLFDCVPNYVHVGPIKTALTRTLHAFTLREDYTLACALKYLSPSQYEDMLYLKQWLMTGGLVTLTTNDTESNVYTGLQLAPGTEPEIKADDDERLHYSFACVLADDTPIVVNYRG